MTEQYTPQRIDGDFAGKDIVSLSQFDPLSLNKLFERTDAMREIARKAQPSRVLEGNIVTLLFYEPSSRTRGSFDAATKQLGGQTVVVENPQQFSSVAKGESFSDTVKTFESYSDAIVLRHPEVGKAKAAAEAAAFVPVINAGDGIGEHPTQALLDLYTIRDEIGRLADLRLLMAGDIKNGRTIHSLLEGLTLYPGNEVTLLSPESLALPNEQIEELEQKGLTVNTIFDERDIPQEPMDIWYWTRVQKERFEDAQEYDALKHKFIVTKDIFNARAGDQTRLMHPLPRVGEIAETVDEDMRAIYLRSQIRNGMYVRMALMAEVLGK